MFPRFTHVRMLLHASLSVRLCTSIREEPMSIRRSLLTVLALALIALPLASPRIAANGEPTRLLRSPSVSATQIAFAYAGNIWAVERAGGLARRLTSFAGESSNPRF